MTAFKMAIALCLGLTNFQVSAGTPPPLQYQLEKGIQIYSTIENTDQAMGLLQVGASEEDVQFLRQRARELKGRPLPAATVKGQLIFFAGLEKPLAVVDLARGQFSYRGQKIDLGAKKSIAKKMRELERILSDEDVGAMQILLPRAHAMDSNSLLGLVSGAMLGGGLAMTVAGLFSGGKGMGLGVGLAALGAIGLFTANDRAEKQRRQVRCFQDPQGVRRVVSYNQEQAEVLSVSYAGNNGSAPVVLPAYTGAYAPPNTAISPIVSICDRSAQVVAFNNAYAPPGQQAGPYNQPPAVTTPYFPTGAAPASLESQSLPSE